MGEVIGILVGLALLGIFVGLPIIAMVMGSRARSEAETLRREVARLEKILRALNDHVRRGDRTPAAAPPPVEQPSASAALVALPPPPPAATQEAPSPPPPPVPPPDREPVRDLALELAPAPRPAPSAPGSPQSLEKFLGERVFLVVGVLVALLALGWFLKVAIDRNWIGPGLRVGLGYAAGVAALLAGARLRARGWAMFGQGVMGGGLGAFYITTFFACVRYGFIDRPTTFGAMAALTAGAALAAILRDAPLLAYLGFFGGFLAPAVLSTGEDRVLELSAWLGILDLGILAVAVKRPWRGLDLLAVLFSVFYFVAWANEHFAAHRVGDGSIALGHLVLLSLGVALLPSILRREVPPATALAASFLAGFLAVVGGSLILHPEHRRALGVGLAGLSALYFAGAHFTAVRCGARDASKVLLVLGVGAVVIAVPFAFEGRGVAPAWSAAGLGLLVLGSLGSRGAPGPLAVGGAGMLFLAAVESLFGGRWGHDPGMRPVLNAAFACAVCPGAALVAAGLLVHRGGKGESAWTGTLLVAGCWLLAGAAASEAWQSAGADRRGGEYTPEAPAAAFAASCVLLAAAALLRRGPETLRTLLLLPILPAFACAALAVFEGPGGEFTPVLRPAFLLGAGTAAAALAAGAVSPGAGGRILQVAALAYLFLLGTGEIFAWGQWRALDGFARQEAVFRAQVAASVAWALYAAALLGSGFLLRRVEFRWTAIVLFGVTLVKVLLYDTARLEPVYRILTFGMLGGLLVAASFLYQRRRAV